MATITAAVGGGNWTAGATWVGGVAPTAADDALLTVASGAVTADAGSVCRSLVCTGYISTLTIANSATALAIGDASGGVLTLVAGMTLTNAGTTATITFKATSDNGGTGWGITTGGKVLPIPIFDGVGGKWVLQDNFSHGTTTMTVTNGAFFGNGKTITGGKFSSTNSNTRTVDITNCAVTLSGTGTAWTTLVITGLTFVGTGSTITCTSDGVQFSSGALTFGSVSFTGPVGVTTLNANSAVFVNLTRTCPAVKSDILSITGPFSGSGVLTLSGNSSINRLHVISNTLGAGRTITWNGTVTSTNADFRDIIATGSASWDLSAGSSGDCGGNSGITFTPAATQTYTGGADNTSTAARWTSRVPLPQDNVIIGAAATGTVTFNMPRVGKDLTFTGFVNTAAFSSTDVDIHGSVILGVGMTISGTRILNLIGRGVQTFTSNTRSLTTPVTVSCPGGSYTLADALVTSLAVLVTAGSFITADQAVTCSTFTTSNPITRAVTLGASTVTLTSTAAVNVWDMAGVTGLTFSGASSTIVISTVSANTRTFVGNGLSYGTLTYTVAGSTGQLRITGSNSFAGINFSDVTNVRTLRLTSATTTTITTLNGFNLDGTAGLLMTLDSSSAGSAATLTSTLNQTVTYASIKDSAATGGGIWLASQSTSVSGNSGWLFADALIVDADAGSGLDAEASIGLASSDTGAGLDAESPPVADLADADTGIGAEAEAYLASLIDAESGSGLDAESQGFGFFEGDFGVGTESESLATAMADGDIGLGTDGGETLHQQTVRRIRASGREPYQVGSGSEQSS